MAKGVLEPHSDFEVDAKTNVMESGLLRVLTDRSSTELIENGEWHAVGDEPVIEVIVEQQQPAVPPESAAPAAEAPPDAPEPIAAPSELTGSLGTPPARRSRLLVGATIVGVLLLVAELSIFVVHRRASRAQPAPAPLPTYVVLPVAASPPQPEPAADVAEAPAPAPAPAIVVMPPQEPKPIPRAPHTRDSGTRAHHHRSKSSH